MTCLYHHHYYRRDGTPVDVENVKDFLKYAEEFETMDRHVASNTLWWGGYLSTVFLGLNHNWFEGEPLIFESMLFYRQHVDLDMRRYSTEEQAKLGHAAMLKKWNNPLHVIIYFCGKGWEYVGDNYNNMIRFFHRVFINRKEQN